jgi:hypothetical protein
MIEVSSPELKIAHRQLKMTAVYQRDSRNFSAYQQACEATMRKHNKILSEAEDQLAFGHHLTHVSRARDNLRQVIPACDLLELLEAKIRRLGGAGPKGVSAWGA